jgi:bisphosphoglycerate-dependent phosphoglycerate mutase
MKTLFLIRHAKSSWDHPALPDKDRPLGDRGRRDARKMGKRLAKRDVKPELTEFAHRLSSEITHMPTCAVAEFPFNAKSWSQIDKAKLAKVALDYPKKS